MILSKAYVFDLDGTLATIPVDWHKVRQELKTVIGAKHELKSVFPTIMDYLVGKPGLRNDAFAIIDRAELEAVPSARLYEGSVELLSKLAETSKLSLVTLQGRRTCSMLLERFGLKQYFVSYFTREDSLDRVEQIQLALASMHTEIATSMFVADRLSDLNAARRLGIPFTMIRTHGSDPIEDDVPLYHTTAEYVRALGL